MQLLRSIVYTALRFLASGVLAVGFCLGLDQLGPLVHPVISGALTLPGFLIAGVLMLTLPLDPLFNLVLSDDAEAPSRVILASYVSIFLFWWAAIFVIWNITLRRRQARQLQLEQVGSAIFGQSERRAAQRAADNSPGRSRQWRYLPQAASAALVLGIWSWHAVPQLQKAYATGLIRTAGGARSGSYVYRQHQPDEFGVVVVVTVLFGLAFVGILLWNLRQYKRFKVGQEPQCSTDAANSSK